MALSETANNVVGAIGGVILAICLAPQLLRMYHTRSAWDLSYVFLSLYSTGLALTAVYLVFEAALVGYISIFVEIGFALSMIAAKYYLDNYGENAHGKDRVKQEPGGSMTAASAARLDLSKFLAGGGGAAFPLMAADEAHAATHLLLDCQLAPFANGATSAPAAAVDGAVDGGAAAAAEAGQAGWGPALPASLQELVQLLSSCLDGAGLHPCRAVFQTFPSFRRVEVSRAGDAASNGGTGPQNLALLSEAHMGGPSLAYIPCHDGYVTALWNARSSTLAVDFLGASQRAIRDMSDAALAFCRDLEAAHPGTKIAASTVARLPLQLV